MALSKIKSPDLLLLLLYSTGSGNDVNEPIAGRTRLIKTIFVFEKEYYSDFRQDNDILEENNLPDFFPWKYGPMSKDVLVDLEFFIKIKFIATKQLKDSLAFEEAEEYTSIINDVSLEQNEEQEYTEEEYKLTDTGKLYVESMLLPLLSDNQKKMLKQLKQRFNKAPLNKILQYVYEKYPSYTEKSVIKDKVLH